MQWTPFTFVPTSSTYFPLFRARLSFIPLSLPLRSWAEPSVHFVSARSLS
ncbi:MAG: hypothetical protein ACTS6G_02985 [Candidatus Hodgkinia cicadicola]